MFNHISHKLSILLSNKQQPNNNTLSLIKQQLFDFNEYVMQQFLKLSVYYQTKLEYQSVEYEEEIMVLKREIERQYKVIGLMKSELEDLVVMVNHQRSNEGDGKEWRVNKDKLWQGCKSAEGNSTSNTQQSSQQSQSSTTQQPLQNTIFGLQVIAQQQTQRTLMSVCDEQQMNNNDEFDETIQKSDEQENNQNHMETKQISRQQSCSKLNYSDEQMKRKDAAVQFQNLSTQQNQQIPYSHHDQPRQQQSNLHNQQISPMVHYREPLFEENEQQEVEHKGGRYRNIYFTSQEQQQQVHQHYQQQKYQTKHPNIPYSKATNFVSNPFAKSKLRPFQTNQSAEYNQFENSNQIQQKLQQRHHSSPKLFLQEFRRSFVEEKANEQVQDKRQRQHVKRGSEDVMEILEMIAMKGGGNEISTRRSQRQQNSKTAVKEHATSSRSRSKLAAQSSHASSKKTKTSRKKRVSTEQSYRLQHPQPFECQNSAKKQQSQYKKSRLTMINNNRCETEGGLSNNEEGIQSSQRYELEEQNDNITQHYWASTSISNDRTQPNNRSQSYQQQNYDQFKSLHTTFGRPASFQCLKQAKIDYGNRGDQQPKDDLQKVPRKLSCGGLSNKSRQLQAKEKSNVTTKENQRQRRMSEKIPTNSKGSSTILEKKSSAKYIKRTNQITPAQQHSITSMLQSHLQQSNKFLIGSKKQQIKYDGQRMTYGHMTLKHGHGILYYSNGLIYQGEFVENKRQGYGLLRFNHVELYSGEWVNDQLNGKGKIRNCAIINKKKKQAGEGHSLQTNKQGAWSALNNIFIKWISYCGSFKSNRFEGQGTLYLQGGEKFVGWFKNGVADGEGSLFKKNGEVQSGRWKNNVMVERQNFINNLIGMRLSTEIIISKVQYNFYAFVF